MKTAVVTDSTAYIPKHIREELGIHMIPLSVVFGNESYQEIVELSTTDFYEMMRTQKQLPSTTQPPTGHFVELFRKIGKRL